MRNGVESQSNIVRSFLSQSRMALRKRIEREKAKVSAESQEDDVSSDRNDVAPLVAARELRRREREHKSNNKEMTEEEMMALALQLSEQEANITAQRLQEEEEAMRKAIQDSIFDDSQSLMDAAAPDVPSRRKLVYSNGESTTGHGEGRSPRAASNRARKHRRVEGSPLTEMPDLSQTQPSPSSSESAPLAFQSPQSCDSTQIEDCDDPQSPVLTSRSPQVQVRIPRLNQDLLDSCATSGFVLCSQDSGAPTQSSHCQKPSPTFPKSPASCPQIPASKVEAANFQMFDLGDDTQPELSQEPRTSPVFGRTDCTSALQADTAEATALSFSSQESSVSSSLNKDVSLIKSPVFLKTQVGGSDRGKCQSPVFGTNGRTVMSQGDELEEEEEDEKAEEEQSLSQTEPTIDMTLHWSEEDEDDVTPVVSPSPVFPEERSLLPTVNDNEESAPSQTQHRPAAPQSGSAVSEAACSSEDLAPQSTVHYYWGVPFCPRGLDPDEYTKVIVAQMEVYEKSLKQAQRGFLNKAKWGDPILPQPEKSPSSEPNSPPLILPTRRSWRLRGKQKGLESEEEAEAEDATEDTQKSQRSLWEEEEAHEKGDKEMKQDAGEEEEAEQQKAVLEDQREAETRGESDCEVCPETQLSDDNTQELTLPSQPLVRSPEVEMVQVDSPNVPEPQTRPTPEPEEPMVQGPESAEEPTESTKPEDMDLEGPHCEPQSRESPQQSQSPHPDPNLDPNPDPNKDPNPDSQELSSPDLVTGPDLGSSTESPVQCPLCQQAFPSDQIEMHAAFCDGAPAADDKASSEPRRKRMRRGETEMPNNTDHEPGVALEKCYICQKLVPLKDYSLHTNRCFQRPQLRTATTGGLLSALDQSEPRDSEAGPSGSTARPHEVIDLVDDDEEEDSVSLIKISNSPIRSFTSISEAQDCLIDFSRQHLGKRPATRLGTKQRSKRR